MIRPYIHLDYSDWDFIGLVLTMGYVEDCKCLQIALTIGYTTVAIGLDLDA